MLLVFAVEPESWPYLVGGGAVLGIGLAVGWFVAARGGGRLSQRIADDLWSRGFAMVGNPPIFQRSAFLLWVESNGATAEQLGAACAEPVIRPAPQRSAGPAPAPLWVSFVLSCVAFVALAGAGAFRAYSGALDYGARPLSEPISFEQLALVWSSACLFLGLVACSVIWFALRGLLRARALAVRLVTPMVAIAIVVCAFAYPESFMLTVVAAASWTACIALLWARSATAYMRATDDLLRAVREESDARRLTS